MTKQTEKQALVAKLSALRVAVGEPPMREKEAAKRSIGVIKSNIEFYEKEAGR